MSECAAFFDGRPLVPGEFTEQELLDIIIWLAQEERRRVAMHSQHVEFMQECLERRRGQPWWLGRVLGGLT